MRTPASRAAVPAMFMLLLWLVPAATLAQTPDPSAVPATGLGDKQVTAFSRDAAGNVAVGDTRTVTVQAP